MSLLIAILPVDQIDQEFDVIRGLFDQGLDALYIRRDLSLEQISVWQQEVGQAYHDKIILPAACFSWRNELTFSRYHIKEQDRSLFFSNYTKADFEGFHLSTPIHDFESLKVWNAYVEQVFVSPVLPSFSKQNYPVMGDEERKKILAYPTLCKKIALGGIDEQQLIARKELLSDFDGVALYSALWNATDRIDTYKRMNLLWKK